jgi:hypothetical protein
VAIGNTAAHRTQIYYNGKLRYDWPMSSGRPGDVSSPPRPGSASGQPGQDVLGGAVQAVEVADHLHAIA